MRTLLFSGLDAVEMSLPLLTTVPELDKTKLPFPHSFNQNKPVVSPSSSVRSRHTSFAQRLRSTGRTVKGKAEVVSIITFCLYYLLLNNFESMCKSCRYFYDFWLDVFILQKQTKLYHSAAVNLS